MTYYIYYLLSVIGIGYFITQSELFKPVRVKITLMNNSTKTKVFSWLLNKLDGVLNCIYCASFWIGIGVSALQYKTLNVDTVLSAFSCMGIIYVIHNLFNKN